jgi:hypothetical protein
MDLIHWVENIMLKAGNISPKDLNLFSVTDDPAEVVDIIEKSEGKRWLEPDGVVTFKNDKIK